LFANPVSGSPGARGPLGALLRKPGTRHFRNKIIL
jgi:hypothetical protein